ncbi:unnamed protein product [Closterium sp. Yama58-4]|nr:unnamed protein product [Closterium sp. Yama58-4]
MVHFVHSYGSGACEAESPCSCCFHRVLGTRGKAALGILSLKDFQRDLLQHLPKSIPLAAPEWQGGGGSLGGEKGNNAAKGVAEVVAEKGAGEAATGAAVIGAAGEGENVAEEEGKGAAEMGAEGGVNDNKWNRAPYLCAKDMILEWMAEPRVGVLMDLGRIRTFLPTIIAATDAPSVPGTSGASSSKSALHSPNPPASVSWQCCWRCSSCWASYRRAVSLCAFLVLVANSPRFVILWRAQLASLTGLFAPIVEELGAHRQGEEDILASVLVQVLGVKGGDEMKDGFKAHVLPLLPGGAEAHREGEGGAGEERRKGGIADGARKGRKGGNWEAGRKGGRRRGKGDGGGAGSSGEWRQGLGGPVWDSSSGVPKGMFESGIGATDFALAVATVLSKPRFSMEACRIFFTDANNEYRVKLENSAAEAARKKVGMGAERERGGADTKSRGAEIGVRDTVKDGWEAVTATSNTLVTVLTWRVSCILMWVRTYGPNLQFSKTCELRTCVKRKEDLPVLRHPFRDVPSLLIRSGTMPEPLARRGFSWEWEEVPAGDEATIQLADDVEGRILYKRILKEVYGATVDWKIPAHAAAASSSAAASKSRPVVRTVADVEFLVELMAAEREPSRCTRCWKCHLRHAAAINYVALLASFAYRPISTLIHRFLFLFPPDQTKEAYMLLRMFMPSGLEERVHWRHVRGHLEGFAEEKEMGTFTQACTMIAWMWAKEEETNPGRFARLAAQEGAEQGKGGVGKWKQLDSEMWEEVRAWRHATKAAWPGDKRNWMGELGDECTGGRKGTNRESSEEEEGEEEGEDEEEVVGGEERPVYAQKWLGGVNLVACLRAMLLGEPWTGGLAAMPETAKRAAGDSATRTRAGAGSRAARSGGAGNPAGTFWTDASGVDTRAERLKSGYRRVCQGPSAVGSPACSGEEPTSEEAVGSGGQRKSPDAQITACDEIPVAIPCLLPVEMCEDRVPAVADRMVLRMLEQDMR